MAFLVLSTITVVHAQSTDCSSQKERGGDAAVIRCQASEKENRARQRVETHNQELELRRNQIENYYDQLQSQIEYQWKQVDFYLERAIDDAEFRERELNLRDRNSTQAEQARVRRASLDRERRLLSRSKDAYIRYLNDRESLELSTIEFDLRELELSVRGLRTLRNQVYLQR